MTDVMISREAEKGMRSLLKRISNLEANDYFNILFSEYEGKEATPPSESEIIAVFGEANLFNVEVAKGILLNTEDGAYWEVTAIKATDTWLINSLTIAV